MEHDESLWTAGGGVTRNIQPHVRGACYRWSMSEVCATEAASDLDAIAAEAWALEVPSERRRGLR
jgi:hypothetical protein